MSRARSHSPLYRLNAWVVAGLSTLAERYCYRPGVTRRLVAVSGGVARELRELFPSMAGSVGVVHNGVDSSVFAPDPRSRSLLRERWGVSEGELVVLFVGGDWERKGVRYAIEGVAGAPGWHLVVVGGGDEDRYRMLAEGAGASERVHFEGPADQTAPYYACADAFLLPTEYEAFSLVTLEAAASGLPLLVPRVNGMDEILVEGRNGWFIDRDGDMIATRLEALRRDEELRVGMGQRAREDSAGFTFASTKS